MMQKLWQIKPKLSYSADILDIVQFGSSVEEGREPNDIDIAVIFKAIPLREQLNQSQEIKKLIQKFVSIPVHIKSFDFYSFFNKGDFAKESILFYGKSLLTGGCFSEIFGITPKIQIRYNLKDLRKKDKVRFNYLLNGKGGKYGLLKKYNGELIAPTLIQISPENENIFINSLKKITYKFVAEKIFLLKE